MGLTYIFIHHMKRPTFSISKIYQFLTQTKALRTCCEEKTHTMALVEVVQQCTSVVVLLMIIREGGRGKSGRLCAHCRDGDCTVCASVQLLMPAQPVQQQLRHTIAATLKMLLSDLSEPDPGIKFVCCKLMEVKMCCFCTWGGSRC